MAITNVIDGVDEAVAVGDATEFSITEATTITADYFGRGEIARVYRLGPSGGYIAATNKDGSIWLSDIPNTVVLDAPGTYKIDKDVTNVAAYVGYE